MREADCFPPSGALSVISARFCASQGHTVAGIPSRLSVRCYWKAGQSTALIELVRVQPFYSTEHVTDMVASADACMRKLQGTSQAVPAEGQRRSTANAPVAHLSK